MKINGVTATKIIRESAQKQPCIIVLTASISECGRTKYLSAGMDNYVSKPITIPQLEEALNLYLKK